MQDFERAKAEILGRVDLIDVVAEHVALKRRGQRWVGLCPFHSEKTPSFTVNPDRGIFKCFGCGKGGDLFSFVQERESISFIEAMRLLADRAGVELAPAGGGSHGGPSRADIARTNGWAQQFFRTNLMAETLGGATRDYVTRRGLSPETSEQFGLGFAPGSGRAILEAAGRAGIERSLLVASDLVRSGTDGGHYDTFRDRLMFPIRDATGRIVGFGGRTLRDDPAKYLNTRETALFDKGRGLYAIELARKTMEERGRTILVEGYTDCLAMHQAGFCETVATLGTALTPAQVDLIRRYCEQVILLFDSDEAGEAAAERAIEIALPRYVSVRLARVPEGKDPCDFMNGHPPQAFSDVLNGAVDALEFKWSQTRKRYNTQGSDSGRREAILDFVRLVANACSTGAVDAIRKGQVAAQLAGLLGIEQAEIHRLMAQALGRSQPRTSRQSEGEKETASAAEERLEPLWLDAVAVLLSEPGLCSLVDRKLLMEEMPGGRDREIAKHLFALWDEFGEFKPADVLARCRDVAQSERVVELLGRAEARGNYEATMRVVITRLGHRRQARELESARREACGTAEAAGPIPAEPLDSIHKSLKGRSHYVPPRFSRNRAGGSTRPSEQD